MSPRERAPTPTQQPTEFAELNDVLADLTQQARRILGGNFVGAYLQGSFAVGDADIHSDCDFLIPVHGPITPEQEAGLRALHDEIPTRNGHWTQHLEGSYPSLDELRTLDGLGAPWLYINHGWREMQWSTHCNSEVVRWSLRERGVVLAGPDPRSLLDQVPAQALRDRMRQQIPTALSDILEWTTLDLAWSQRYAVATLCRMLYTLRMARVASKKAALNWAYGNVDPRWRPLLLQAREDRARGFDPSAHPPPGSVSATVAFAGYVQDLAAQ
jgi:predicted nucleotidyltransferase